LRVEILTENRVPPIILLVKRQSYFACFLRLLGAPETGAIRQELGIPPQRSEQSESQKRPVCEKSKIIFPNVFVGICAI
jgi:hypothetical protein